MKLYQLIATSAMAVLALAGCNKNEAEAPEETNPDAGMKEVSISISGLATKGQITPSEPWVEDIAKIAEFDIYFTSATGAIKYAYTFSESEYSDAYNEFKDGGSVRFIGLKDISKVYVTANTTTKLSVGANISAFGKVLLENYGVPCPISVIPTGIDISLYSDPLSAADAKAVREKYGISQNDVLFTYCGRLAAEKNIEVVIRAFGKRKEGRRLLIIGDGPMRKTLELLSKEIGTDAVFAGMLDKKEVSMCYRASDVFVSASRSETQGLTFIEAISSFARSVEALYRTVSSGNPERIEEFDTKNKT